MHWKVKKYLLPLCTAAFTTLAAEGGALADIIYLTPGDFVANSFVNDGTGSSTESDTVTFDSFDGNLGMLTGVNMEIDYSRESTLIIDGSEGGKGTSNHQGLATFALMGVADEVVFSDDLSAICSGSCSETDDASDDVTAADFFALLGLGGPNLASFIGTGIETYDIVLETSTNLTICQDNFFAGLDCDAMTNWSGTIYVEYTFTPNEEPSQIPEPSTMGLFGVGLMGIGYLRRRRKAA